MSQYSGEMETIKQRLVEKEKELIAESIADAVKGAYEKKEKTVEQANQELNELVAIKESIGKELGTKDKKLLDDAITFATQRRNETVRIAEEEYASLIEVARKTARDTVDEIDWATGEIKTKWQQFWDNTSTGASGAIANLSNMGMSVKNTTEILAKHLQIVGLEMQKAWQRARACPTQSRLSRRLRP